MRTRFTTSPGTGLSGGTVHEGRNRVRRVRILSFDKLNGTGNPSLDLQEKVGKFDPPVRRTVRLQHLAAGLEEVSHAPIRPLAIVVEGGGDLDDALEEGLVVPFFLEPHVLEDLMGLKEAAGIVEAHTFPQPAVQAVLALLLAQVPGHWVE
jgi:hypothetical protein